MIEVYFDGACEPVNPGGHAAYGLVIFRDGLMIHEDSKLFVPLKGREKKTSNNVAEYSGSLAALAWLLAQGLNDEEIVFYGDSMLVINQMFGRWAIHTGFYKSLAIKAKKLLKKFPKAHGQWIPREKNSRADELSRRQLINAGVTFRIQPQL